MTAQSSAVDSRTPLQSMGERQRALLQLLHRHKEGLTTDEIAGALGITRTAVRQHVAVLEGDEYVHRGEMRRTAGRPGFVYLLTRRGEELFPRNYSWFSGLLLASLQEMHGSEGLARYMRNLAANLAAGVKDARPEIAEDADLAGLMRLMNDLGYDSESVVGERGEREIRAYNCVYHHLAEHYPALCAFDVELISTLSGLDVDHAECMVRGGQCCRFLLTPR